MEAKLGKLKLLKIFLRVEKDLNEDSTSGKKEINYFIFFWIEPINLPEL